MFAQLLFAQTLFTSELRASFLFPIFRQLLNFIERIPVVSTVKKKLRSIRIKVVRFSPTGGVWFAKYTRILPVSQSTTICAKRRRCDAAPDISAWGDLPSPRPFFRRTRGDPCIKAFFLLAMASETTISFNHSIATVFQEQPHFGKHAVYCKSHVFTSVYKNSQL